MDAERYLAQLRARIAVLEFDSRACRNEADAAHAAKNPERELRAVNQARMREFAADELRCALAYAIDCAATESA